MITDFVGKTFSTRNAAHLEHFATGSYAAHMALGSFYEELPGLVDSVVEAYQGHMGKIGPVEFPSVDFSVDHLREEADWIEVNRTEISGGSDAIANLVDAVTDLYLSTIYKLTSLK